MLVCFDLYNSARHQEGYDVLGLDNDLADLFSNLSALLLQLLLSFDSGLVFDGNAFILLEFLYELLFKLGTFAFLLELVETVHEHVLRMYIFNPHHVQEHVVAQMERRVQGITLAFQDGLGTIWL